MTPLVGYAFGAALPLLTGAVCLYAITRSTALGRSVSHEQVRRERLRRYFSPQVATMLSEQADVPEAGVSREVTLLFCDLRQFTAIAESLGGAEVVRLLNEFHTCMVDVVFAHGGTFLGDGLMAYFARGPTRPRDARRALRARHAIGTRHDEC